MSIPDIRAALVEPVGDGPTDDELLEAAAKALGYKCIPSDETCLTAEAAELLTFARAVLARYGTPRAAQPPAAQPPVERVTKLREKFERIIKCSRVYDSLTMTPVELADRLIDAVKLEADRG
jgi:hypothetical protein